MTFVLVPQEVASTAAEIWVGAIDEGDVQRRPVSLELRGDDGSELVVEPEASGWSTWKSYRSTDSDTYPPSDRLLHRLLAGPSQIVRTLDYQRVRVERLRPRTAYSLRLRVDGRTVAAGLERHLREGSVTTLPERLPARGDRPFTLLVGSCFYGPEDPDGMVGTTYQHLPEDRRPDVKVLCGDQVYLDNPWRESTFKWYRGNRRPGLFRAMLFRKYMDNWRQVRSEDAGFRHLLKDGANYFCSDDHEFWNNAPNFGGVGLVNTLTRKQREWWMREAQDLFRAFQSPSPLLSLEIPPLSVRVVDTRICRDPAGKHFIREGDLEALGRWVESLEGPGILVLGQPFLAEKNGLARALLRKGLKKTLLGYFDRDLPDYAQYDELSRYIRASEHSIVVLTGDVHYGRVAHGELRAGSQAQLVEVISSPMQAVLDDRGSPLFGSYRGAPAHEFPGFKSLEACSGQNHFVTVEFLSSPANRVSMTVRSWPILRAGEGVPPRSQVVFEITLS